uniref:Ig-like domain-containing protein n=1 Tax=Anser brachyrhynchus TaxID=132585 RepID=A0A8B9BBY9_9AVES
MSRFTAQTWTYCGSATTRAGVRAGRAAALGAVEAGAVGGVGGSPAPLRPGPAPTLLPQPRPCCWVPAWCRCQGAPSRPVPAPRCSGCLVPDPEGCFQIQPSLLPPHTVQNHFSLSWGAPGHHIPALHHPHSSQDPQRQRGCCPHCPIPLLSPWCFRPPPQNLRDSPHPISAPGHPTAFTTLYKPLAAPKYSGAGPQPSLSRVQKSVTGQCVAPACAAGGVCASLKGWDCGNPSPPAPGCVSGFHTLQYMYGCDLLEDGSIRGFMQDAYEGRDFLTFDKDTLTFTAADAGAQITKRKWEEEGTYPEQMKHYLENTCIEWLRKYVSYGKAVLERRERPEVQVSGMEADRILTLSCRAHGFYPRPISISWLKDGVVQEQETQRGSTVPNSDGTYHAWATIDVLPGDKDKYQCRVEHASLPQPGLFSWEPQSNLIPIVAGVAVAVVAVIAALAGFAVWKSKQGSNPSV